MDLEGLSSRKRGNDSPGFELLPVLTLNHPSLGAHPACLVGTLASSGSSRSLALLYPETCFSAACRGAVKSLAIRTITFSEKNGRSCPRVRRTDTDLASLSVILQILHQFVSENIQRAPGLL